MLGWLRRRRVRVEPGASLEATQAAMTAQRKLHEARVLRPIVSETAAAFRAQVTRQANTARADPGC
jgi:hypothetical protein